MLRSPFSVLAIVMSMFLTETSRSEQGEPKAQTQPAVKPHDPEALEIGAVAPDIEGEDVDGARLKLSDYRGKVVVVDFWGDW